MYAYPEVLVETDWVKRNLGKPSIRLVEIVVARRLTQPDIFPEQSDLTGRPNSRINFAGTSSARKVSRS